MPSIHDLARGVVLETRTKSWTGSFFYSDKMYKGFLRPWEHSIDPQPMLNELARLPVIGIAAGIMRMALAAIHTTGHLIASLVTFDKGHLFHAAKGVCEFSRGLIEAIPFAGQKFAKTYYEHGTWWILKIYNPESPDSLDIYANLWREFRQNRPNGYVVA